MSPVKELTPKMLPLSATNIELEVIGETSVQINPSLSFVRKYPRSPLNPVASTTVSLILKVLVSIFAVALVPIPTAILPSTLTTVSLVVIPGIPKS